MLKKLCQKYHNFFNIWNVDWLAFYWITDHAINLKSDIEFLYMCTYNMFSAELKTLDNYLNNILIKKWIHKFQNSADALIFFIFWKNEELHFCVDYCELNIIIIKNCYFLSLTSKLLNQLNSSIVFSKIDLQNIYHKIYIHQNNKWKTAFHMWYRHFEYQIVSFNLTNISIIFQVYINCALCDLIDNFCIVYLDNILVFLKSKKKHYQHLQLIIKCLWHAELYANLKKCKFFKLKVKYLDFLINENDLHMNLSHVQMISDWCNHSSKIFHNIQIFIEFCNFYWWFIFNFADIAWFLHSLLYDMKKNRKSDLITDK